MTELETLALLFLPIILMVGFLIAEHLFPFDSEE